MNIDDRMTITVGNNEARDRLIVQLGGEGRPLAHFLLAAPEADDVISKAENNRAALADEIQGEFEPTSRANVLEQPAWAVSKPRSDGRFVLAIRHPGFGWLAFGIEVERTNAIAAALVVPA